MNPPMRAFFNKWLLIINLSIGAAPSLLAQDHARLEGRINDEQNHPLASTTVTLVDPYGNFRSKITSTDSTGRFSINEIPFGLFTCKISHTGYQPISREGIFFTPTSSSINLGDLTMLLSAGILAEVTVSARSPIIRNATDKKIFAVNQSLVSLGGSAADLLQNVP